jgi:hypothetical protein
MPHDEDLLWAADDSEFCRKTWGSNSEGATAELTKRQGDDGWPFALSLAGSDHEVAMCLTQGTRKVGKHEPTPRRPVTVHRRADSPRRGSSVRGVLRGRGGRGDGDHRREVRGACWMR